MIEKDNRLTCSDDKKALIKASYQKTLSKRESQILKVYELKIVEKRLNKSQKESLERLFVEGKWFYNHVLSVHRNGVALKDINTTKIKVVNHFDKDNNQIESELEALGSQMKQSIVTRMISNERTIFALVQKGLQTHGSLSFRKELNSIPLKQYGITYKFASENKIRIQGIKGKLLVRGVDQLKGVTDLANANLVRKADGYYLNVTTYTDKKNFKEPKSNGREVGLDFGIKTSLVTSDEENINLCIEESDRLKKLQKKLARQVKGSDNRQKTINKIRREYLHQNNKKHDLANKVCSRMKKYDRIVIQDEQIAEWHKTYGKTVQHSCMGLIKEKLKLLPQTIVLDKWIPTTKWCSECGTVNRHITLNDRTFTCGCGCTEDRDVHAAKNMLEIYHLISKNISIPTERRKLTLEEFKTAVEAKFDKSER